MMINDYPLQKELDRIASALEDLVELQIMARKGVKESTVISEAETLPTVKERAAEIKNIAVGYVRSEKLSNESIKSLLTELNISRMDEFTTHQQMDDFTKSLDKLIKLQESK